MPVIAETCGAIFNVLNSPDRYGRVAFVSSYFNIPRSSLYRLCNKFSETFGNGPGRPRKSDEQRQVQYLEKKILDLSRENVKLKEELITQERFQKAIVDHLKFTLICLGMQSREIVEVVYQVFGIRTNTHQHSAARCDWLPGKRPRL